MSEGHSFISATLAELSRRKVLRTLGGYAVGVFVLLQLMDAAVEPLRLPDWLPTLVVILLILGFPVVFLLAWHFDITSGGIKRTSREGALLSRRQSSVLFGAMLMLTAALGYGFAKYYAEVFDEPPQREQVVEQRQFNAPSNSIAVLPFADLSAAGDQAFLGDGIAEEILNLLAQVDGLHVAARTSSFAFRDREEDIREVGRLLNVRTVLEGSVRTFDDRVRLTAQLINVEDGYHIWSQSYDRQVDDLFAIQDEVASSIAGALLDSFNGLERPSVQSTDSLAAANAYRTGRLHWWRRTARELEQALKYFAEALQHDAGFAPAYAGMADTWLLLSMYGNISPPEAIDKAQPMIEKALGLDPASAEAFAALGLARWQIGQLDSAESSLLRAIELNEDYIPAHLWLGGLLGQQGRYAEEHRVLQHAMTLDPLNELLVANFANNLYLRGELEKGRNVLQEQISLRPDSTLLLRSFAGQELMCGQLVEAWRLAQKSYVLEPENPADLMILVKTLTTIGDYAAAEELLLKGLEQAGRNFDILNAYWLTLLASGRIEEADRLTRELMAEAGDSMPEALGRKFELQLGILAMAREDWPSAEQHLAASLVSEDGSGYSPDHLFALSLAALTAKRIDRADLMEGRLREIDRQIQRARINGLDNADVYYTEAAVLALREQREAAMEKLEQAFQRGFREHWLLSMDWRLDGLRDLDRFQALDQRLVDELRRVRAEVSKGLAMR